jgi:hypothetical protein
MPYSWVTSNNIWCMPGWLTESTNTLVRRACLQADICARDLQNTMVTSQPQFSLTRVRNVASSKLRLRHSRRQSHLRRSALSGEKVDCLLDIGTRLPTVARRPAGCSTTARSSLSCLDHSSSPLHIRIGFRFFSLASGVTKILQCLWAIAYGTSHRSLLYGCRNKAGVDLDMTLDLLQIVTNIAFCHVNLLKPSGNFTYHQV